MARRVRTSQKDRLSRLRAEKAAKDTPAKKAAAKKAAAKKAAATKAAPAAKKAPAKKRASRARKATKTGRKIVVWAVYDSAFRVVETFPFKEQLQAEKLARKLTREKKKTYMARRLKQDM